MKSPRLSEFKSYPTVQARSSNGLCPNKQKEPVLNPLSNTTNKEYPKRQLKSQKPKGNQKRTMCWSW